jgi:type II secretory pathway pseudopilin PulG
MKRNAQGFSFIGLLILLAILAIALTGTAELVSTTQKRERELELLFVGTQYARAITAYHSSSPGLAAYPTDLEDLLEDNRFPDTRRHLRKLYRDPLTNKPQWGLVRGPNNGIVGVYSLAEGKPLKQENFPKDYPEFAGAESYAKWQFLGVPRGGAAPANAPGRSNSPH